MSFPVAGTLMVEATESESKTEIDRFCDAMIAIRAEITEIADGRVPLDDSALHHAPHPAEDLLVDTWDHPYTREQAAFPVAELRTRIPHQLQVLKEQGGSRIRAGNRDSPVA